MSSTVQQYKSLLQWIAWVHIVAGLLLPVIVHTPVFSVYQQHLIKALAMTPGDTNGINFLVAILGPTVASWGILLFMAINHAFDKPTPKSWWMIIIASSVWAVYDSLLSLYYGVYWNAILNLIVFISIVIPLLKVKTVFFDSKPR